ncbi:hypothetical protein D3C78_1493880 [compost metagenome]
MRTINLLIMSGVAISSFVMALLLFTGDNRGFTYSAASVIPLSFMVVISIIYATLVMRNPIKQALSQVVIFALYVASSISGSLAAGSIGLTPYIMKSKELGFWSAFSYVWPAVTIGSLATFFIFIFSVNYSYKKRISPVQHPQVSA